MHWGMGFWPLFPLFWIGIISCIVWGARRWSGYRHERYAPPFTHHQPDALEILRQRYAHGEIDATTFDQMRERLYASYQSTTGPGPRY